MVLLESVLGFLLLSVSLISGDVPEKTTIVPLDANTLKTNPTPPGGLALDDDGKSTSEPPLKPVTPPSNGKVSSPISVVKNVINSVKTQAKKLFDFMKNLISPVTNRLKNLFTPEGNPVIRLVSSVIGKLKNLFTFDKNPIINTMNKVFGPVVNTLKNLIKPDQNPIVQTLKKLIGPVVNTLKNLIKPDQNPIVQTLKKLIGPVIDKLKNLVKTVGTGNSIVNLFNRIITSVINFLKNLSKPHGSKNGNPIVNIVKNLLTPITDFMDVLLQPYDSDGNTIVDLIKRFINANLKLLKKIFNPHGSGTDIFIVNNAKSSKSAMSPKIDTGDSRGLKIPIGLVEGPKNIFNHFVTFWKNIYASPDYGTLGFFKILFTKPAIVVRNFITQFIILLRNILTPYIPSKYLALLPNDKEIDERGVKIMLGPFDLMKDFLSHFVNFFKNISATPEYGSSGFFKILFTKPAIVVRNVISQFIILLRNILTPYVPSKLLSILRNDKEVAERGVQIFLGPFDLVKDFLSHFVNFFKNVFSPPGYYGSSGIFKMIFTHPITFVKHVYTQVIILVKNVLTPFVPSKVIDSLTRLLPRSDDGSARGLEIPLLSAGSPKTSIATHLVRFLKDLFAPTGYSFLEFIQISFNQPNIFLKNLFRQFFLLVSNVLSPYVPSSVMDFLLTNLLPPPVPNKKELVMVDNTARLGAARGLHTPILPLTPSKSNILIHFKNFLKNIISSPEYGSLDIFKIIFTQPAVFLKNVISQFIILLRNVLTPYIPNKYLALLPNHKEAAERGLKFVFQLINFLKSFSINFVTFLKNIFAPPGYGFPGFIKILFTHPVIFVRTVYVQFILLVRNVVTPYASSNFIGFLMRLLPHSDPSYKEAAARGLLINSFDPVVFVKSIITHFVNFFKNIFTSPEYGSVGFFKIIFTRPIIFLRIIYTQVIILVRNVIIPIAPSNVVGFLTKLIPPGAIAAPSEKVAVSQPAPSRNRGFIGFLWTTIVFIFGVVRKIALFVIWKVGGFGLIVFGQLLHHGIFLLMNLLPWPASAIVTAILTRVDYCPRFDNLHPLLVFVARGSQCVTNPLLRIWELVSNLVQVELSLLHGASFFGTIRRIIVMKMNVILTVIKEIIGFFPCIGWVGVKILWTSLRCVVGL